MKLVKRIWCSTVLLMLAMVKMVYAGEPIGNASLEYHEPSVLLQSPVLERTMRGGLDYQQEYCKLLMEKMEHYILQ